MLTRRSADHYRSEAARCRALAAASSIPALRQMLDDVATTYDSLAREVEELTNDGHWPPPTAK